MIIGILLGLSLAVFLNSLLLLIVKFSGVIIPLKITGSVIGPTQVTSLAIIAFILSTLSLLYLINLLKKYHTDYH